MLNRFQIGRYYFKDSIVHNINPTVKIICIFLCVIMLLFPHSIWFDIIILFGLLILAYMSKVPCYLYLNSFLGLKYFYFSIFLINLICGVPIISSFQMIFKICIMILYSQILVLTTSLQDMMSEINNVLSPLEIFKIRTKELTFCLSLAISFIPLIIEQANYIMKSLASRGIDYKNISLYRKLTVIRAIIFPIFILTLKKADHLAESLDVRRYNIKSDYFNDKGKKWDKIDICILGIHIILFFILVLGVIL